MAWISVNRVLTQSEMENNADIIISYYRSINYNDKTIAAILGNMEAESTLSPVREEIDGAGYGLVQWTPESKLQNHCNTLGLSPHTSGDVQLQVLDKELGTASVNEWYTSSAFIHNYTSSGATDDMIGVTSSEFKRNDMNFSVSKLTILFMAGYERPSTNPNVNHIDKRKSFSSKWYQYIGGHSPEPPVPPTPPLPPEPPYIVPKIKRRGNRVVAYKKYLQ